MATTAVAVAVATTFTGGAGVVAAADPAPGDFFTSFEDGQPQPEVSTAEVGDDGPRQQNVSGTAASDGSLLGQVVDVTASAENAPGEVAASLADANPDTKWLAFEPTGWVRYELARPAAVVRWSMTSANDAPQRDPKDVTLQGSTDGEEWTDLDRRTGLDFPDRYATLEFEVEPSQEFLHYRLDVTANHSGGIVQLADWDISDGSTGDGAASPMVTKVGSGPISGFNIKPLVGWTGLKAMRFSGGHTAEGRGYAWNRLFDVDVPVGPDSRLTYRIFPDMVSGDLTYPSTYSAVDLRFTDGTYLSDLGAEDVHGTSASPSGQGAGKILYANQWNAVTVELGAVAAGRTVDRVLVGYDNPEASTDTRFGGWLDDLGIEGSPTAVDASDLTGFVDVRRGTNSSSSFSRGNNLPISALPNGFTFLTPVTNATSQSWEYSWQSANNDANLPVLEGLAVSHEPSPWMGDRNQLSVMPSTASGTPTGNADARGLAFDHATEVARPDYYRAVLAGGIVAEHTPADHGGVFRFTFPDDADTGHLVLDTVDDSGAFTVHDDGTVTGWVDNGSGLSAGRSRMFVHGTFDHAPTVSGVAPDGHTGTRYATFDTSEDTQVVLRLATSFISLDQAERNLGLELTDRDFDAVRHAANTAWNERLGVVEVEGANDSDRTTLYSNLYRLNLYPNSQFENTGTAADPVFEYASPVSPTSGEATETTTNAKVVEGKVYVNNGFWDTYRTVWPAYSLLYPEVAAEIADGFVQQYRDGGWVARWSSPGYADLMTGTSSDVAFADAYVKGVPLPDPLGAYDAAVKNATVLPTSSAVGRKGIDTSTFIGYTSTKTGESVSWGLEGFINDFGIGTMADRLAKDPATPRARRARLREESAYFLERATHYVNSFDPEVDFFRGRQADGRFPAEEFDPESWGHDFTETNGWNFAFHAPHDGVGLANLYGGRDGLADKLDEFFATPETATKPGGYGGVIHEMREARDVRMGMLGQSNQVSHHIPYMYDWTGQPWKTAEKVREIMRRLYTGAEIGQGYPGDEDNGEMSAWYVLSALGIYPLQVGSSEWAVGSPKFERTTVHRTQGDLVVNAPRNSEENIYVQGLRIDGTKHRSLSIDQSELRGRTRVDFSMGPKPSSFGTRAEDAPPSLTTGSEPPNPLRDATGSGRGSASASDLADGSAATALFDNTSRTSATFSTDRPRVTYELSGNGQRATWYTLTSGPQDGDPTAWRLEGSKNGGKTWRTLDRRSHESFAWRVQTRPFRVARPGTYTSYRLVVTAATGAVTLSEVELLTDGSRASVGPLTVTATDPVEVSEGQEWSGVLATFAGGRGRGDSEATATIAWGDGTTSEGTVEPGDLGTSSVSGTHTWEGPGPYRPTVTVTQGRESASGLASATVHQAVVPSYAEGFDLRCIGDVGTTVPCDGGRSGVARQALADEGVVPGKLVEVPGTGLRWSLPAVPAGEPDSATGAGQTLDVTLAPGATQMSLIGTATQKDQDTTATVTFTDGSSVEYPVRYGDWCGGVTFDNVLAVEMGYRLNGTGTDSCRLKLFATAPLDIPEGKQVASVTMPEQTGDPQTAGRVHVFAVADDGAPVAFDPAAAARAARGKAAEVTLGAVSGGVPGDGYTARVEWGDGSDTEDATVSVAEDGTATLTGTHTWSRSGTYRVQVLVGDSRSDVLGSLTVTVR
ncbi:GH92 family glycosyl hydrolase [Phycicoccus sp. CSK15P-2]|uniref:GH92 family glycosyl hydrolase n=1 Tax=Phycicoccus sp. CSK15P-2 TaxID=2807627 RepID=UPI0027DE5ABA|nr:GH92 family glycosyl hydrolase [Phycicoccus sp. CSK15P-2]